MFKVPFFSSIRFKVFAMVAFCLLATVGAITYQNISTLYDHLYATAEEKIGLQANDEAFRVSTFLLSLSSQFATAVTSRRQIENFFKSDNAYVAVQIFEPGRQPREYFSGALSKEVSKIQAAHRQQFGQATNRSLVFFESSPLSFSIGRQIELNQSRVWVYLAFTKDLLWTQTSKSPNSESFLYGVNSQKKFSREALQVGSHPGLNSLFRLADSGLQSGITHFETQGDPFLASYATIEGFADFAMVTVRNARVIQDVIWKEIYYSLIWVWVFLIFFTLVSYQFSKAITNRVQQATLSSLKIAGGNFSIRIPENGRDEVSLLSRAINYLATQIVFLLQNKVEEARREKELETTKIVQNAFFPDPFLDFNMLEVSGQTINASECSGDWWGAFQTRNGDEFLIVCDATGHGAPAALVTAMAYTGFHFVNEITNKQQSINLKVVASLLNKIFYKAGNGKTSFTCFMCLVSKEGGKMQYVNAGHNHPLVLKSVKGKLKVKSVKGGGSPIGINPIWEGEVYSTELNEEDLFCLYTDGVIEGVNPKGSQWGIKSLKKVLESTPQLDNVGVQQLKEHIMHQATNFFENKPQDDDITLIMMKPKVAAAKKNDLPQKLAG